MALRLNEAFKEASKVGKELSVKEALTTADANILIPRVISQVMLEAAEPVYLASQFFAPVNLESGRSMEFINFGAIRAFDIAEGQEYPDQTLDFTMYGGPTTEVKVGKVGMKVQITDEMINDSQWDVIGMHLRAASRAMARKKEEKCFTEFTKRGHVVFDGNAAEGSDGYPTGRGYDGTLNGTLTAEDLMDMCVSIMAAGFTPTDIIMHPLCWSLFAKNEMVQDLSVAAFGGGGSASIDPASAPQRPMDLNKVGSANFNLPISGLKVNFSPWVPFDQVNKKFDFYIIDRNNVGVMLIKNTMTTEQFDDPLRDIQTLKVMERYGLGVLHGGLGIAVAKNVAFKKTYPAPQRAFVEMARPDDMTNDKMDNIKMPGME
jgi:hypothetical protein